MGFFYDQQGSPPGITTARETYEAAIRWGHSSLGLITGVQIDGTARDAGASPTTILRAGIILGRIGTGGMRYKQFSDTATDGSEVASRILLEPVRMVDFDGNNANRFFYALAAGPVQAANLIGLTSLSRAQLSARGFLFDDDTFNPFGWNKITAKTTSYTLTAADTGTIFTTTGGTSVTFTLPTTIVKGFYARFVNVAATTMTITAPSGKLVAPNNAAATSIAFSTGSQIIGSVADIYVDEAATKYIAVIMGPNAVTVS